MRWLVQTSLRFRLIVVALAAGVLLVGVTQLPAMPVDVLPEFGLPSVEVQTEALGLSAQEVEQLITVPLEQDLLNGVPWLAEIRSESLPGLSSVIMTFDEGTDPVHARQVVGERLTQAFALPHVSRPPTMLQPTSASNRVLMVGLSGKNLSLIDLSVLARWTIAPRLMGVPGVANVSIWGQRDRQLQVQVDPEQLRARNVTLLQVLETTGNAMWVSSLSFVEASTPGTGGFIETPNQRLGIRHVFPISSADDLARVPVEGMAGLTLGDVANVVEDHQPLIGDAAAGPSLLLVVEKSPSANTLEVTDGLDKAIAAMRPGLSGVEIDASLYRPAGFIESVLGNMQRALALGGVLAVLVIGVCLFDWRAALTSAIAIPVSVTAGALVLNARGASANMMVAVGFLAAIGVLIDDAILDLSALFRGLRSRLPGPGAPSITSLILTSTLQMRSAAVYAMIIMLIAIAPLWLIGGLTGALVQPLALSYALAVLASMLVALVVTHALCVLLVGRSRLTTPESRAWGLVTRGYTRALNILLRRPRTAFSALAVTGVIGLALLPLTGRAALPSLKEPDLLIHLRAAPGTSRIEMDRIVTRMGDELRSVAGVTSVGGHVGRALLSDRLTDVDSAELWLSIDPSAPYDTTTAAIRRVVNGYPGLKHAVHTYLEDRTAPLAADAPPLLVRVFGDRQDQLRAVADDVQRALAAVPGVAGQHLHAPVQQATVDIAVDLTAAQRYGLKPGDIRRAAATLVSGIQAGSLFEDQKVFDVVVVGTPETRASLSRVHDLLLDTPDGGHVRLGDVARVQVVPAVSVIQHQDVHDYLDIQLDVHGRGVAAVAADVTERLQQMQLPLETHAEVVGNYVGQEASQARLVAASVAAALGILLVLQACFGNWALALYGLVLLPLSLVGGLVAIVAMGGGIGLGALAGLLAVGGLSARTSIAFIRHCQLLQRREGLTLNLNLILVQRAASDRVGPVLATAVGTELALLPFVVWGNLAGFELVRPLAVVVMGGLISATLLNMFVTPAACLLLAAEPAPAETPVVSVPTVAVAVGQASD